MLILSISLFIFYYFSQTLPLPEKKKDVKYFITSRLKYKLGDKKRKVNDVKEKMKEKEKEKGKEKGKANDVKDKDKKKTNELKEEDY